MISVKRKPYITYYYDIIIIRNVTEPITLFPKISPQLNKKMRARSLQTKPVTNFPYLDLKTAKEKKELSSSLYFLPISP